MSARRPLEEALGQLPIAGERGPRSATGVETAELGERQAAVRGHDRTGSGRQERAVALDDPFQSVSVALD